MLSKTQEPQVISTWTHSPTLSKLRAWLNGLGHLELWKHWKEWPQMPRSLEEHDITSDGVQFYGKHIWLSLGRQVEDFSMSNLGTIWQSFYLTLPKLFLLNPMWLFQVPYLFPHHLLLAKDCTSYLIEKIGSDSCERPGLPHPPLTYSLRLRGSCIGVLQRNRTNKTHKNK